MESSSAVNAGAEPCAPELIHADECLLPSGPRSVMAPAAGWSAPTSAAVPRLIPAAPTQDTVWWAASLGVMFILGMATCLLVLVFALRATGARLVVEPVVTATSADEWRDGPGGSGEVEK